MQRGRRATRSCGMEDFGRWALFSLGQGVALGILLAAILIPGLPTPVRVLLGILALALSVYCLVKSECSCCLCDLLIHWPFW